jgi:predicted ATPase
LTKKFLTNLNRELEKVSEKYVINNAGYKTQTKNSRPRRETLQKSKELKGLVLNNFIPMKVTNLREITHSFTYSFTPGLYQIQGLNGIGKTTLLQTLALPEGSPVEYAKGEAALNGEPFYNEKESIEEHRDRIFYISAKSPQKNPDDLDEKHLTRYATINQVIEATKQREHKIQSEGEAGLINICWAIQKIMNGNKGMYLLCIDEILSRMYNDNRYPLRDEIKMLLGDIATEGKCIILVVDHMTLHEKAIQLKMSTKSISLI